MTKEKLKEYAESIVDLCRYLEITPQAFDKGWKHREGNPGITEDGWPIKAWIEFKLSEEAKSDGSSTQLELDGSMLDQVRARDVKLKDMQIAELVGQLVPLADHKAEISDLCQIFLRYLEQVASSASAMTRDPKLVKRIKELHRNTRIRLADELEKGMPE